MEKSKNELIEKRRKKKRIERVSLIMVLLIAVLITLCLKLPYFNIQYINVLNNKTITSDEIIKESGLQKNTNIFYINSTNIKNNILNNPYILSAAISRKLPNTINIDVSERKAVFYAEKGNKFVIIDKNGIILEIRDNIENMNLIKIIGVDTAKVSIGKVVPLKDDRKLKTISVLTDIIFNNDIGKNIKVLNITNNMELQAYYNDMCIKLGNSDNLQKKLNRAINIINDENLASSKGYVDVSFNGNPVFFVEK